MGNVISKVKTMRSECFACKKSFSGSGLTVNINGNEQMCCADCYWKLENEYDQKKTCEDCEYFNDEFCERIGKKLVPVQIGFNSYFVEAETCAVSFKDRRFCVDCTFYYRILNGLDASRFSQNVNSFPTHYCKKLELKLENPVGDEAEKCTSFLTPKEYKDKALSGEMNKEKGIVQIILDFSSLKDVMSKGGLVMSTYKCPNCNGMISIPEAGKVLMCQYCGTPIKPVDIFEKVKSLIQ